MDFIITTLKEILMIVFDMAKIIIPLMIIIEILKDLKVLEKLATVIKPVTDFFTMNEKSAVSMIVGLFIGILYGAGVIMQSVKDENLDKRSVLLVCIFLSLCHAIVEDTIIFKATGAYLIPIITCRVIAATSLTFIYSRFINKTNINLDNEELQDLANHEH